MSRITASFSGSGTAVYTTLTLAHREEGWPAQYSLWLRLAKFLKLSHCRSLRPSLDWTVAGESRSLMVVDGEVMSNEPGSGGSNATQRADGCERLESPGCTLQYLFSLVPE